MYPWFGKRQNPYKSEVKKTLVKRTKNVSLKRRLNSADCSLMDKVWGSDSHSSTPRACTVIC